MEQPGETELFRLILIGTIIMFGLALAVVLFFVLYQRRVIKQQIKLKQVETEHQRKLLQSAITMQEQERARIAKDLHDDIGSSLGAASLFLHKLLLYTDHPEAKEAGQELKSIIVDTLKSVQEISHELLPAILESFGLQEAVKALVDRLRKASGIQVVYEEEPIPRLPTAHELALYRMVKELVNNVVKHAEATHVHIVLRADGEQVQLVVADNGKGFDVPFKGEKSGHIGLGLNSIAARADHIGATVEFHSDRTQGTRVVICLAYS